MAIFIQCPEPASSAGGSADRGEKRGNCIASATKNPRAEPPELHPENFRREGHFLSCFQRSRGDHRSVVSCLRSTTGLKAREDVEIGSDSSGVTRFERRWSGEISVYQPARWTRLTGNRRVVPSGQPPPRDGRPPLRADIRPRPGNLSRPGHFLCAFLFFLRKFCTLRNPVSEIS